jgi:hypothetical protein
LTLTLSTVEYRIKVFLRLKSLQTDMDEKKEGEDGKFLFAL